MKVKLDFGQEIDLLTQAEVAQVLAKRDTAMRAELAGKKYRRMPPLTGKAVSGVLDIGGESQAGWNGQPIGPDQGYVWAFRRLAVSGLTTGTTPDIVNLHRHGSGTGSVVWQFNGNNFAYTFSFAEMVFLPGETIRITNVGTFAATGNIGLTGDLVQVPSERLGELV